MNARHFIRAVFITALVVVNGSPGTFALTSPWGYRCDSEKGVCIKEETTGSYNYTCLARCKLTCSPEGVLWPKPTSVSLVDNVVEFLPDGITHTIQAHTEVASLLEQAIAIFKDDIQKNHPGYHNGGASWEGPYDPATETHTLNLNLIVSGVDTRLNLDTDESYSLSISTTGALSTANIIAPTFFGARHALETLSQLIDFHDESDALMLVSEATIDDAPAFGYRGVLLDTARNFFPIEAIQRTLDAMASSKLNTFHWHITDSHSFPLYMESLPEMTRYGTYSSNQIYNPADVKGIVEYGRVRGIRVLPEFDAPAHVGNGFQWGPQYELGNLAVCVNREPWASYCVEPPCGQLNLANQHMYDVLSKIYIEFINQFMPIDLFHFGGDEVNLNCWNTTQEIIDWMTSEGFGLSTDAYLEQWSIFQQNARQLLIEANNGKEVPGILWTSSLTEAGNVGKYLSSDEYIIQIWTTGDDPVIGELLDNNFRVIFSNYDHNYLDCGFGAWIGEGNNWCSPYKGWQTVYDNNPLKIASNLRDNFDPNLILGGEVALWTEQTDEAALDSRLWPRGAALGERLWANPEHNWEPAEIRLINHRQRMVKRGIKADRIQPEWCHQNEGLCYA